MNTTISIFDYQKASLLACRKIELVKGMLLSMDYGHERSQAILRKELKKQQALRDKFRKIVKKLVEKAERAYSLARMEGNLAKGYRIVEGKITLCID